MVGIIEAPPAPASPAAVGTVGSPGRGPPSLLRLRLRALPTAEDLCMGLLDRGFDPRDLEVVVSDLLIATADTSDQLLDAFTLQLGILLDY